MRNVLSAQKYARMPSSLKHITPATEATSGRVYNTTHVPHVSDFATARKTKTGRTHNQKHQQNRWEVIQIQEILSRLNRTRCDRARPGSWYACCCSSGTGGLQQGRCKCNGTLWISHYQCMDPPNYRPCTGAVYATHSTCTQHFHRLMMAGL